MQEMKITSSNTYLEKVQNFISNSIQICECNNKIRNQLMLAVEEIFINIARYAYYPESGEVTIQCDVMGENRTIMIKMIDKGKPFNPLSMEEPDITANLEEREAGGLGIMLAKKSANRIEYTFENGMNMLTIYKYY